MNEEESTTFTLSEIESVLEAVYGFRIGDLKVATHFLNLRKSLPEGSLVLSGQSIRYDDVVSRDVSVFRVPMDGPKYRVRGVVSDFVNLDRGVRALVIDGRIKVLNANDYVIVHEHKESISETR